MIVAKVFKKEEGGEWLPAMTFGEGWSEGSILAVVKDYQLRDFKRGVIAFYSVSLLRRIRYGHALVDWAQYHAMEKLEPEHLPICLN